MPIIQHHWRQSEVQNQMQNEPSSSVNHIYANYMINEQTVDLPLGKNARERDRFMSQFFISFFMFGMHTQQSARLIESA